MPLIMIQDAAKYLGTSEDRIVEWINRGLLQARILLHAPPSGKSSTSHLGGVLQLVSAQSCIDRDDLEEVAETEGWLSMAASTADEEND